MDPFIIKLYCFFFHWVTRVKFFLVFPTKEGFCGLYKLFGRKYIEGMGSKLLSGGSKLTHHCKNQNYLYLLLGVGGGLRRGVWGCYSLFPGFALLTLLNKNLSLKSHFLPFLPSPLTCIYFVWFSHIPFYHLDFQPCFH